MLSSVWPVRPNPSLKAPTHYGTRAWPRGAAVLSCATRPSAAASAVGLARTLGRMKNTLTHLSPVCFVVLTAFLATAASAKVSAEEVLCVRPNRTEIEPTTLAQFESLRARARELGRLDGIFVTTLVTRPPQESRATSERRAANILAKLQTLGLSHPQAAPDFHQSDRDSSEECGAGRVAVQVELLFQEPSYLSTPPKR
jgi:hypothetical protein